MRPCLPLLIKARALITDQAKWGKGIRGVGTGRALDTCCAAEAIEDVSPLAPDTRQEAYRVLCSVIGQNGITSWNDAPERTHAEVLAAFDKAIEAAT